MRNATYLGLCWAMTLGLVAVALGQQQSEKTWRNAPNSAPQQIDTTGLPIENALPGTPSTGSNAVFAPTNPVYDANKIGEGPALPAPDRSLLVGTNQSEQPAKNDAPRTGQLGVWMGETGGPGVRILRVTSGSAAQQAGLRVGDIILQVNGRDATSPHDTATLIRRVPIGEAGKLVIWRNGNQQELQITMQPIRDSARQIANDSPRQPSFGPTDSAESDLASRTMRLEQQINSLTQELAKMRQELAQLRTAGPVQTSFSSNANPTAPPQPRFNEAPKIATPAPTNPVAPPPGFGPSENKPAAPPADEAKPAAPPAPPAEKSSSADLFNPTPAQPKSDDQPKAEEKPKSDNKGTADDLFK